jgi:hypothetical protein
MAIVPFASHSAPRLTTNIAGASTTVAALTFGGSSPVVALASNGSVALMGENQDTFTLPYDAVIENIYVTFNTIIDYMFPPGLTVYPVLQLYDAVQDSNVFMPVAATKLIAEAGYTGAVPSHTPASASLRQLGLYLRAGTRLLIGGRMETAGSANLARDYYFYFTGAIALREA